MEESGEEMGCPFDSDLRTNMSTEIVLNGQPYVVDKCVVTPKPAEKPDAEQQVQAALWALANFPMHHR